MRESTRQASSASPEVTCPSCGAAAGARCAACGTALRAGPYHVERVLARTAHSRVYVARDEAGRAVALKELSFVHVPSAEQLDAFDREARVLASLQHPAVPRFVGTFREGAGPALRLYLAAELVDGETLEQRVARGPLSVEEARVLGRRLLEIVRFLHTSSPPLLHRDIKPANVVFRGDGQPALVDFGTARFIKNTGETFGSTLVGTFGYMPPEQLGGTVDASSDVYAVAATLLHAVSGRPPAELLDETGLRLQVPSSVAEPLRSWLTQALAVDRTARFRSAAAAMEALESGRTLRRPRRRGLVAAVAATAVVMVGLGAAVLARPARPPVALAQPRDAFAAMQPLPPEPVAQLPEHLRPRSTPSHATSLKVVTATPNLAALYLDLTYAGEAGQEATVCAQVLTPEGIAKPLTFACSPTGVKQGRGFYTLQVQLADDTPQGQLETSAIGYQLYGPDGHTIQQEYFHFPHQWDSE